MSNPAYDRMTDMWTRKAEQTIAYAGLIGKWQGLADHAVMAMEHKNQEWLLDVLIEMQQHSNACDREMQLWK